MFRENLMRAALAKSGIGAKELAKVIGVNESTMSRKMTGKSDFTRSEIQAICQHLNLTAEEKDDIFFAV